MNIYHIVFTDCDYDEYDSFVVIAKDEDDAKKLIKWRIPVGESIKKIECIGVSHKSESKVVLGSFNAG